jgi:hypothetical protein
MTKIAVVTAMFLIEFPELDTLSSNFEKCDNYDYYVFTNDKTVIEKITNEWNIIEIDCSNQTKGVYLTKRVKWLTHEYLPDYDIIIWVDSFIVPNSLKIDEIHEMIDKVFHTNVPIMMIVIDDKQVKWYNGSAKIEEWLRGYGMNGSAVQPQYAHPSHEAQQPQSPSKPKKSKKA